MVEKFYQKNSRYCWHQTRIPMVKLKIPGKAGYRTSVTFKLQFLALGQFFQLGNFCHGFLRTGLSTSGKTLFIFFTFFFMVANLLSPNRCHWQIAKAKNYNLNVTEVLDSDFKNAFPRIFNFTVEILGETRVKVLPSSLNLAAQCNRSYFVFMTQCYAGCQNLR